MSTSNTARVEGDYEGDGFIRIRAFLQPSELSELRTQMDRYAREVLPKIPSGDRVLEADDKAVRNLWRMEQHDSFFADFARRKPILDLIAPLVHGTPVLMGVETFNKAAKIGSGVPPHQDNAYFCQSPPDVLTIWIAIDAATMENGPIFYVKGSHKAGLRTHRPSGVAGNSMGLTQMPDVADEDRFCGTLDPGDALIHHCETIHYSGPNKSDRPRCGLLLVYRGEHTKSDPEYRARYEAAQKK
jgi:ectoine hydroxylase-related dioxygenase (phytanoyl-CoA dioxygenase family)